MKKDMNVKEIRFTVECDCGSTIVFVGVRPTLEYYCPACNDKLSKRSIASTQELWLVEPGD